MRGEKNKSAPINFDGVDYRPDIAVGRWPVSTEVEVRRVAGKSIRYEEQVIAGTAAHIRRAAFLAVSGWVDSRSLMEKLANRIPPGWTVEKRLYRDPRKDYGTPPPSEAELLALLNDGVAMVCHTGHGQDDCWEQCFYLKKLDRVRNAGHLPVMISIGCSTARFATLPPYESYVDVQGVTHAGSDHKEVFTAPPPPPACYQRGRFNPVGLGEQLLRAGDHGAVAYIGCNTGSQPCALTLLEGFLTTLREAPEPRLGDFWAGAVGFYYDRERLATLKPTSSWYPASMFFQGMKFMLFGDPFLQLPRLTCKP